QVLAITREVKERNNGFRVIGDPKGLVRQPSASFSLAHFDAQSIPPPSLRSRGSGRLALRNAQGNHSIQLDRRMAKLREEVAQRRQGAGPFVDAFARVCRVAHDAEEIEISQ